VKEEVTLELERFDETSATDKATSSQERVLASSLDTLLTSPSLLAVNIFPLRRKNHV
jgi:hypothetical protein